MDGTPGKYDNVQVTLHWVTALVVVFMLLMGHFALAATPNSDADKLFALRGHMIVGGFALLLTLVRIAWARLRPQPAHASTGNLLLDRVGVLTHLALNLLVLLVALSGIGIAVTAGLPEIVFAGQGSLPASFADLPARTAHGVLTKLLAALVLLHVAGALFHVFVLKDRLFRRLWFGADG